VPIHGCFSSQSSWKRGSLQPGIERDHDKANRRVWNVEERKDLGRKLSEELRDNPVSDRRAVNIAPLQLGEEIPGISSDDGSSRHAIPTEVVVA
jgi:hypothetical protein